MGFLPSFRHFSFLAQPDSPILNIWVILIILATFERRPHRQRAKHFLSEMRPLFAVYFLRWSLEREGMANGRGWVQQSPVYGRNLRGPRNWVHHHSGDMVFCGKGHFCDQKCPLLAVVLRRFSFIVIVIVTTDTHCSNKAPKKWCESLLAEICGGPRNWTGSLPTPVTQRCHGAKRNNYIVAKDIFVTKNALYFRWGDFEVVSNLRCTKKGGDYDSAEIWAKIKKVQRTGLEPGTSRLRALPPTNWARADDLWRIGKWCWENAVMGTQKIPIPGTSFYCHKSTNCTNNAVFSNLKYHCCT